jgi:hypothetical protein
VQAATFATLQSAVDDEFGHLNEIAEFKQARLDAEIPIILSDFVGKGTDASAGSLKALGRADDPNIVPHGATELIPVVGKYHAFVRVARCPVNPGWQSHDLSTLSDDLVMGGRGAVVREDHRFEQGVGG